MAQIKQKLKYLLGTSRYLLRNTVPKLLINSMWYFYSLITNNLFNISTVIHAYAPLQHAGYQLVSITMMFLYK
jgi:hypothetical protein